MNKKLSFFESIYLNKKNKEFIQNKHAGISSNSNTVADNVSLGDTAPVNLVKNSPIEFEESFISSVSTNQVDLETSYTETTQPEILKDSTTLSENITEDIVEDIADFEENTVDHEIALSVSELNVSDNNTLNDYKDDVLETNNDNKNENTDNLLTGELAATPKKKKKKKKKKITSISNDGDTSNNSGEPLNNNEHTVNDNKNIQSNIDGIGDVLNKVVKNSNDSVSENLLNESFLKESILKENLSSKIADNDSELAKEEDDLFLHIEIPSNELDEINDLNDLENLELNIEDESNVFFNKDSGLSLNENSNVDLDENLDVNLDLTSQKSQDNESFGIMHFDLDDQLSELDLEGNIERNIKKNHEENIQKSSSISSSFEKDTLLTNSTLSTKESEYDPQYRNSFYEDDVALDSNSNNTLDENSSTNTSFALLDTLDVDVENNEIKSDNDNEETKVNIPLI